MVINLACCVVNVNDCDVMQEDVGRDNDLHSTVANRIVELAKHDQKKLTARQSGVAVIAVRLKWRLYWRTCSTNTCPTREHVCRT